MGKDTAVDSKVDTMVFGRGKVSIYIRKALIFFL